MRIHYDAGVSGLAGTVGYTIYAAAGTVAVARATAGVTEEPAGSGSYGVTVADATLAGCTVVWDNGVGTIGGSESFSPDFHMLPKMLRNKTVESADGTTITLYDDDGATVIGSWSWSDTTRTRGRLS